MQKVKDLAPTIIDALKALEQGCRTIQQDNHFRLNVCSWLHIIDNVCYGCLATTTLMQLTNKTGKDLVKSLAVVTDAGEDITDQERTNAYGLADESDNPFSDLTLFEMAIDNLRYKDLKPLLQYYDLPYHENADIAAQCYYYTQPRTIGISVAKRDLLDYADYLKNQFIPKMESWFPATT